MVVESKKRSGAITDAGQTWRDWRLWRLQSTWRLGRMGGIGGSMRARRELKDILDGEYKSEQKHILRSMQIQSALGTRERVRIASCRVSAFTIGISVQKDEVYHKNYHDAKRPSRCIALQYYNPSKPTFFLVNGRPGPTTNHLRSLQSPNISYRPAVRDYAAIRRALRSEEWAAGVAD